MLYSTHRSGEKSIFIFFANAAGEGGEIPTLGSPAGAEYRRLHRFAMIFLLHYRRTGTGAVSFPLTTLSVCVCVSNCFDLVSMVEWWRHKKMGIVAQAK